MKEFILKVVCPILFCAIVFQAIVEAAGTVTTTETTLTSPKRVVFQWISDATGEASATTTNYYTGRLVQTTISQSSSTDQPTDLYDVSIYDSVTSEELLGGCGTNNATAIVSKSIVGASLGWVANSKMILSVQNAGAVKSGTVIVYVW